MAPDVASYEWDEMRVAKGRDISLRNGLYDVQLDYINENGRYSPPSSIKSAVVYDSFPGGLWGNYVWDNYIWG